MLTIENCTYQQIQLIATKIEMIPVIMYYSFTRLEHPNKLLHTIFEKLYDNDVISEEGFQVYNQCLFLNFPLSRCVALT